MTMEQRIQQLDDTAALALLSRMARPHLHSGKETALGPELRQALAERFGPAPAGPAPGQGDLARQALCLLAVGDDTRAPLVALLDGPAPERFGPSETVALVTAALIALQVHVKIERTPGGKWKLLLDKPSASEALLKPLVQQLLALFPSSKT